MNKGVNLKCSGTKEDIQCVIKTLEKIYIVIPTSDFIDNGPEKPGSFHMFFTIAGGVVKQ